MISTQNLKVKRFKALNIIIVHQVSTNHYLKIKLAVHITCKIILSSVTALFQMQYCTDDYYYIIMLYAHSNQQKMSYFYI